MSRYASAAYQIVSIHFLEEETAILTNFDHRKDARFVQASTPGKDVHPQISDTRAID